MEENTIRIRRRIILNTVNIPTDTGTSARLKELVMDDHVDVSSLAQAIQSEPGVTARILSVANSAFLSQSTTIHTIEQAIDSVLGLPMVRSLCLEMLMRPSFNTESCSRFSIQKYWCRAQSVAHSSAMLAKELGFEDTRSVYLAGLMHNVGLLLQVHHFPKEMNELLPKFNALKNQARIAQERKWLGVDACEAGSWLAKRWNLPQETTCVLSHFQEHNYQGEHWPVVHIIGFVVRFYQGEGMGDITSLCDKFNVDPHSLRHLQENFIEIEKSVTVLSEFLAQNSREN